VLGDPGFEMVEAVVALGDEEEEPDGQDLAGGGWAFPVGRSREVPVQGGRRIQTLGRVDKFWARYIDWATATAP
jgi:hypothetical protein